MATELQRTDAGLGWRRRRLGAGALRAALTLVPIGISLGTAILLGGMVPGGSGTIGTAVHSLLLALCSLAALVVSDKLARRLLPLAALLQLSLLFPDQTPSRFKLALKAGSGRRLAREVEHARAHGLSSEPVLAAEQLVLLASSIGDHDRRTRGHSERVRLYTELIAEELHLAPEERAKLQWAALIHDVGKLQVPATILNKKSKPDEREWAILQGHPAAGEALVAPVEGWLGEWVAAVGGHHERWDGSGYPRGLRGEEIARAAAIVAVADAFEVMTAVRSYKGAMPLAEARAELTRCSGTHFSPVVVRAMLNVSVGKLRRSMGIFAALAHVPFLGQMSKAAAATPDSVSTAVSFTTSSATSAGVGVSVAMFSGALAVSAAPAVGATLHAASISAISVIAPADRDIHAPDGEPTQGDAADASSVSTPSSIDGRTTGRLADEPAGPQAASTSGGVVETAVVGDLASMTGTSVYGTTVAPTAPAPTAPAPTAPAPTAPAPAEPGQMRSGQPAPALTTGAPGTGAPTADPSGGKAGDDKHPDDKTKAPKAEDDKTKTPKVEDDKTKAPKAEDDKTKAPKAEDDKTKAPKAEDDKTKAPKVEEDKSNEPKTAPGKPVK
jgi:hypothetical protein